MLYLIIELMLKNKEEELNLIIVELRKSLSSLQEKVSKEESEKLVRNKEKIQNSVCFSDKLLVCWLFFVIHLCLRTPSRLQ